MCAHAQLEACSLELWGRAQEQHLPGRLHALLAWCSARARCSRTWRVLPAAPQCPWGGTRPGAAAPRHTSCAAAHPHTRPHQAFHHCHHRCCSHPRCLRCPRCLPPPPPPQSSAPAPSVASRQKCCCHCCRHCCRCHRLGHAPPPHPPRAPPLRQGFPPRRPLPHCHPAPLLHRHWWLQPPHCLLQHQGLAPQGTTRAWTGCLQCTGAGEAAQLCRARLSEAGWAGGAGEPGTM